MLVASMCFHDDALQFAWMHDFEGAFGPEGDSQHKVF
jgi:hypothetical protein